MAGFRATAGGVTARFAASEALIIRDLVAQVAELVGGPDAGYQAEPDLDLTGGAGDAPVLGADELAELAGFAELAGLTGLAGFGELAGPAEPPDDPILARLLPDAYRDDPEAAQDFRRFTEAGLRSAKVAAARTVLATMPPGGGRVRLSAEQGETWLRALNDIRLAMGVHLGITDDFDGLSDDIEPQDPRYGYFYIYQWLASVQESLVLAL